MLEVGQILSLKIRFNNHGIVAKEYHPYLILKIHEEINAIEIGQIDSLEGKAFEAIKKCNKVIFQGYPTESVIDKDSYIQLNNTLLIEHYAGLLKYRRQEDKLSDKKLQDVIAKYEEYHRLNQIDPDRIVYMDQIEIEKLNKGHKRYKS